MYVLLCHCLFQFTHPGRGATVCFACTMLKYRVSIHAPREGCDAFEGFRSNAYLPVSIHAPREGCDVYKELSENGQ